MQKSFCDRCKKEMPIGVRRNYRIGLDIHYMGSKKQEDYDSFEYIYHDICQGCAESIEEFITGQEVPAALIPDRPIE